MTDVAIIGARGHVGAELMALIDAHPKMKLAAAGSRALAGQEAIAGVTYEAIDPALAPLISLDDEGVRGLNALFTRGATLHGASPYIRQLLDTG